MSWPVCKGTLCAAAHLDMASLGTSSSPSGVSAECVTRFKGHTSDVNGVAIHGRTLVSCGGDKTVRLWNMDNLSETNKSPLRGHEYYVNCVKFSPSGAVLVSCSTDGKAILWDVKSGSKVSTLQQPSRGGLRVCAFSPDSRFLVTGGDDEVLVVWDMDSKRQISQCVGHEGAISGVAFTPDNTAVVSGSTAGDLRLWDVRSGQQLCCVKEAHDLGVMCCDFRPDDFRPDDSSLLMATAGNDTLVKLWQVTVKFTNSKMKMSREMSGHSANVFCCVFNPSGSLLASGGGDHSVIIWNPNTGELLHRITEHQRYVTCCTFSPCGEFLASGSNDRTVILYKLHTYGSGGYAMSQSGNQMYPSIEPSTCDVNTQLNKLLCDWTVHEVSLWLTQLGLQQYGDVFLKNAIDGRELMNLSHDMLMNHLGVDVVAHRNQMLRSVDKLKENPWGLDTYNDTVPGEYLCPITHEIMDDPVISADGYTYERRAIQAWYHQGKKTSPMTNQALPHFDLTPNRMLKMLIQKHKTTSVAPPTSGVTHGVKKKKPTAPKP